MLLVAKYHVVRNQHRCCENASNVVLSIGTVRYGQNKETVAGVFQNTFFFEQIYEFEVLKF